MSINYTLIIQILSVLFLLYGIAIVLSYIFSAFFSIFELRDYKRRNNFQNETALLQSANLPPVSILAPAYNEEATLVDNIKSLLTLNYPNYEIIIINDGSKDSSLQLLIDNFGLVKQELVHYKLAKSKPIKGIYTSTISAYKSLKVIDKDNGGKADALNAGINCCKHNMICSIDVDCILVRDALLKLIKPFLNNSKRVIASGGVIRVVNNCRVEGGNIIDVRLPKSFIGKVQILEYFRAFLMGRMAWTRVDGLLLISGAFGMFDKEIVVEAGGFNPDTVGEDMELLVRMRRMMREKNLDYKVGFIPDPLCWTEVPESFKILSNQRNRWTRGTIETLLLHKKMIFNPKYGLLGMLSIPYWMLFEWLAPFIELAGVIFFVVLLTLDKVNFQIFGIFFGVIYTFSVLFSITAILFEEFSFQQYKKPKYVFLLILAALLEPIIYHPVVMIAAIRGNIDWARGKKSWGEMTRAGLGNATK